MTIALILPYPFSLCVHVLRVSRVSLPYTCLDLLPLLHASFLPIPPISNIPHTTAFQPSLIIAGHQRLLPITRSVLLVSSALFLPAAAWCALSCCD